jgi:hypothetical protein
MVLINCDAYIVEREKSKYRKVRCSVTEKISYIKLTNYLDSL